MNAKLCSVAERTITEMMKSGAKYGEIRETLNGFQSFLSPAMFNGLVAVLDEDYVKPIENTPESLDKSWEWLLYQHETAKTFSVYDMYKGINDPNMPYWFVLNLTGRLHAYLQDRIGVICGSGLLGQIQTDIRHIHYFDGAYARGQVYNDRDAREKLEFWSKEMKRYKNSIAEIEKDEWNPEFSDVKELHVALSQMEDAYAMLMKSFMIR